MCLGSKQRHLREVDYSLARPAASVDSSSYVASHSSHYEAHFGTPCGAMSPHIQRQAAGLPSMANERSISLRCLWF